MSTEQTSTSAPGRVPGAGCRVLGAKRPQRLVLRTGTHGPNPISAQELDMVCFPSATFYWLKILAKEEDSVTRENSGRFRSQRPRIKSRVNPATAPSYVSVLGTIYTTEQSPESLKHRPLRLAKQTNKRSASPWTGTRNACGGRFLAEARGGGGAGPRRAARPSGRLQAGRLIAPSPRVQSASVTVKGEAPAGQVGGGVSRTA